VHRRDTLILLLVLSAFVLPIEGMGRDTTRTGWEPSPTGAALRSLVLPGWGQAYARQPVESVIYGGLECGLIYGVIRQHKQFLYYDRIDDDHRADFYRNSRNRLTWYLAGAVILSVVDAYVDAQLFQFDVSDDLSSAGGNRGMLTAGIRFNLSGRFD